MLPDIWNDQSFLWTTASKFQINIATLLCICLFSSGCNPAVKTYLFWSRESCCLLPRASATREEHSPACAGCCSTLLEHRVQSCLATQSKLTSSPCAGSRDQSNPGVGKKQREAWCMETGCLQGCTEGMMEVGMAELCDMSSPRWHTRGQPWALQDMVKLWGLQGTDETSCKGRKVLTPPLPWPPTCTRSAQYNLFWPLH